MVKVTNTAVMGLVVVLVFVAFFVFTTMYFSRVVGVMSHNLGRNSFVVWFIKALFIFIMLIMLLVFILIMTYLIAENVGYILLNVK